MFFSPQLEVVMLCVCMHIPYIPDHLIPNALWLDLLYVCNANIPDSQSDGVSCISVFIHSLENGVLTYL